MGPTVVFGVLWFASVGAPGRQPPVASDQPLPPCVLFDGKPAAVRALRYSAKDRATPQAKPGTPIATFALSLNYKVPMGWKILKYEWVNLWKNTSREDPPGMLILGSGDRHTAVGCAYKPGVYQVYCQVTIGNLKVKRMTLRQALQGDCAVIGGPLGIVPAVAQYPLLVDGRDPAAFSVPDHDLDDLSKPFHLQYFGYDPRKGVPQDFQAARSYANVSCLGQPPGTKMAWHLDPPLAQSNGGGPDDLSVQVVACAPTEKPAKVSCKFSLVFNGMHGQATLTDAEDDTVQTPNPQGDGKVRLVNSFNVHRPTSLRLVDQVDDEAAAAGRFPADSPAGGTSCGREFGMQVLSQHGVPMPGVWVRERYVSAAGSEAPPKGYGNPNGFAWCTHGLEAKGRFGAFSGCRLHWTWDPSKEPPPWKPHRLTVQFWAATRSVLDGGVPLGAWRVTFVPGKPNGFGKVAIEADGT